MAAGQGTETEAVAGQGRPLTWWPAAVQPPWSKVQVSPPPPPCSWPASGGREPGALPSLATEAVPVPPWSTLGTAATQAQGRLAQRSGRDLCSRLQRDWPAQHPRQAERKQSGPSWWTGRPAPPFNRPSPNLAPVCQTPPPRMGTGGLWGLHAVRDPQGPLLPQLTTGCPSRLGGGTGREWSRC